MHHAAVLFFIAVIGLGTIGARAAASSAEEVQAIEWRNLVPPGYNPTELITKYRRDVADLKDDDPRALQLAEALRKAWEGAPVVESLANTMVKLSGFLVSLEGDGTAVSEFLLVPFFGACIHVPPPPSNQIVLVRTGTPFTRGRMFQRVSVTGRLRTEKASHQLASAAYVIEAARVEPHVP
ncbi:MAG TPA: DUF3299 domain-containing protein [Candidatus Binatia bacterium]|jgi:uncharacterized protein|nr:DUF3299 domain-containing protein [Candidatus Binatia bacterium]